MAEDVIWVVQWTQPGFGELRFVYHRIDSAQRCLARVAARPDVSGARLRRFVPESVLHQPKRRGRKALRPGTRKAILARYS
jgi:hypothetical protein